MLKFLVAFLAICTWAIAQEESIHKPLLDLDDDLYATDYGYRGANWRGKDSLDLDKTIHPGVQKDDDDGLVDYDCSGIYGWSDEKDQSYHDLYSKTSSPRGVVIFGDSAAAAFHIPEEWVKDLGLKGIAQLFNWDKVRQNAITANKNRGRDDMLDVIANEFDWPQKSWATGFNDDVANSQISTSIYLKMRDRNRANHRDYQNLGVNGAKAKDLIDQVGDFARTPQDKPVLAFVAYIGNDICKKHLEDMTTGPEFRQQILDGLAALDKKTPANSKVVLFGLVDGRILWETMHDRMHPLGMTYGELYETLWSMEANPCRNWLTNDANSRDKASERARELSSIMKEIATTQKYQNFELAYMDLPMEEVIGMWKAQGGQVSDLIEVVDGFHPSHTCHRMLAKVIWDKLEKNYPAFIGPVNPHNDEIIKHFGDQSGH